MSGLLTSMLAALLAAAAVFLALLAVIRRREAAGIRTGLAMIERLGDQMPTATMDDVRPRPVSLALPLVHLARAITPPRSRERLRKHLAWGGRITGTDLDRAFELKSIYGIAGLSLGILIGFRAGGFAWISAPVLTAAGFFLQDILIYNRGLKRTEQIERELPDALDLLNLCVESGLSLQAGLARVARGREGAVAQEFSRVLQEMQLGVSRQEAFESLAARTRQEDLQRFVTAMLQVDRLGIPVASVLREQALDMRARRKSRAREKAQKVPVTMLAPLLLCFMPGLFIVILGPSLIRVIDVMTNRQ